MKIAILGYGNQGRAAFDYWSNKDNQITICDANIKLDTPEGVTTKLGEDYLKNLDEFDVIVRSPAIHPKAIVKANSDNILAKVTTVTNEFFKVCPSENIIGVTGTKGKGTTSTLVTEILRASGKVVHLAGNIGTPPLDLLKENIKPNDWVVLELANFQLIDLKYAPKIGVCVMIVPEHLDWHDSLDEYFAAKKQLFINQTEQEIAVYYGKNEYSKAIASVGKGKKVAYYHPSGAYVENDDIIIDGQSICEVDEIKMLGRHNLQNICAAITAFWQIEKNVDAIRKVITNFKGLPFRTELRREVNGIKYYNDSFAANPGATIAAIEAIPETKVLLIGGYERGIQLDELLDAIVNNKDSIRKVIVYGAVASKVVTELKKIKYDNYVWHDNNDNGMDSIVGSATSFAKPGDAIVLSPGFASFDMFKNFEERGKAFNESVEKL